MARKDKSMPALTCKNHLDRVWSCKDVAITGEGHAARYNGARNIFYFGSEPFVRFDDGSGINATGHLPECPCPASDLRVIDPAQWDAFIARAVVMINNRLTTLEGEVI